MGNAAWFWGRMSARYARTAIANEAAYQQKLATTREYLADAAEVFEFGCGTGSTAIAHAPYAGRILAIDAAPEMIDIARGKAAGASLDTVDFQVGDIADFDLGGRAFDMVLGLNILHLLDDWRGAIDRACALLKPGGVFVSSTACLAEGPTAFRVIAPLMRALPLLPSVQVLSEGELVEVMQQAGFGIEHRWRPSRAEAVFLVARKQGLSTDSTAGAQ
ncbi:class I SAM-dependent methyltransferase [Parahaliea mediterranea]|uniref:Class I SAM-dependent methyltransferase n=1 Tax=Parahaliea mediterranea TaxID=651086 RepID=A0A939DIM9_9GAMM|nr:class I SAM-dependent methyltransferase [Parahaliea mediterranea]MBN7798994.1 class I SAM-dependent methyltransferase [Parahaliea mediterranea]